jgi:hypothetical protein
LDRLEPPGIGRLAALWLATALAAAGVAASITAVYLGMRDLMVESGGACASGGPYVIANECSSGQVALLSGGLVAMLVFAGVHAAVEHWADGPRIGWPAIVAVLFLALGWNFIDLGLDPPREDGSSAGWLVSGVVFWLMAAGFLAPAAMRAVEWVRRGGEPEEPIFKEATVRAVVPSGSTTAPTGVAPAGAGGSSTTALTGGVPTGAPPSVPPTGVPAADVPKRLVVPPRAPDELGS